jgi:hypothetical protein
MRRGRIVTGVSAGIAAALIAAPGALAAGSQPAAKHAKDATAQVYNNNGNKSGLPKGSNVAGSKSGGSVAGTPLKTTKSGTLPFTGSELGIFTVVAFALLGMGLLLRASGREKKAERI